MKKNRMSRLNQQKLYGVLYILPGMLIVLVFSILAIILAFYFSFTEYNMLTPPKFIGFNNYVNMFKSSTFWAALRNTFIYVIITVPIQTILALAIALFIANKLQNRYGSFLKSTIFIPVIISSIAASAVWGIIFKTRGGLMNNLLGLFGIAPMNWLGDKTLAFICVCIVTIWKNVGYYMVIYYAGIMGIPKEQEEAAVVDGASVLQRLWYVTLPNLKPITYMVITLGVISSFQIFDIVFQLTGGGPGTSTVTLAYMIYNFAFSNNKMGYASAIAVVLLIFVLIIHALQDLLFKEKAE